jgi:hypothetical protein
MELMTKGKIVDLFLEPDSLEFMIARASGEEKYNIAIRRRVGQDCEDVLFMPPFAERYDDAVELIECFLEGIRKIGEREIADPVYRDHLLAQGKALEPAKALTPRLAARILFALRENRKVRVVDLIAPSEAAASPRASLAY